MGSTAGEHPRDIFRAACAEIAWSFEPMGFRYLRSKSRIERQEGDLRFAIWFVTSQRGTTWSRRTGGRGRLRVCDISGAAKVSKLPTR